MVSQMIITWAVVSLWVPLATKMNWTRSLPLQTPSKSINTWMNRNRLCINNAKTEVVMVGSQSQLNKCITTALDVNGTMVWTSKMSFKYHISTKCITAMWNLQCLKLLQPSLTVQACIILVLGLGMAHLNYVNSLFLSLPASDINKMQRVQHAAAKFVLNLKRMDSSTEALKCCTGCPLSLGSNSEFCY